MSDFGGTDSAVVMSIHGQPPLQVLPYIHRSMNCANIGSLANSCSRLVGASWSYGHCTLKYDCRPLAKYSSENISSCYIFISAMP